MGSYSPCYKSIQVKPLPGSRQIQWTTIWWYSFFSENRVWHFMQAVSLGNSLHEMSKPVFLNKSKIYFKMSAVDFYFFDRAIGMRNYYFCKHFSYFFYYGFTALSRIFHLYRADSSSVVGENRRIRWKTTWQSVSRTWLSHMWPERGSNHAQGWET